MKKLLLSLALCTLLGGVANATTIDTTGSAFLTNIGPFGEPNTATYGQTFTVGTDNQLNSFSLWLTGSVTAPIDFAGYIYKWDGLKATGPNLYSSGVQHFLGSSTPQEFAFSTGGINLTSGDKYVAFLNSSNFFDGINSYALMPLVAGSTYTNGTYVFYNNGNNFSALTSINWDYPGHDTQGYEAFFKADFSEASAPVPEPGTMALLGLGMAGLAFYGKRRQKKA